MNNLQALQRRFSPSMEESLLLKPVPKEQKEQPSRTSFHLTGMDYRQRLLLAGNQRLSRPDIQWRACHLLGLAHGSLVRDRP